MTEYRILVLDALGKKKWQTIDATAETQCIEQILAAGMTPLQIKSGQKDLTEILNQPIRFGAGIGLAEQALILNQLAVLVQSGLPVDRSLDLLRDQSPKARQRHLVSAMLADVKEGRGLAGALEKAGIFPDYCIGVVRAAEQGGNLGEALTSIAMQMTKSSETRQKLITALTYPAAVIAATFVALILILTTVIPQFRPIFEGNEEQLPALTNFVLWLSLTFNANALLIFCLMLFVGVFIWLFAKSESGQGFLERAFPFLPGSTLRDQYLAAQYTGLLGTLTANGLTAVSALPLSRDAMPSRRWRKQLSLLEIKVREGGRLSFALRDMSVFPLTASRLIEVGERTGKLSQTCLNASKIMGDAAAARIERIVSLANPVAIIILGAVVALLVAGVMLGIFSLGNLAL